MRTCEDGCNGCDDCTDYDDYGDDAFESPDFGCCLPPGTCCMPGLHFPSECHTASDYERAQFGGWASEAGPRKTPNDPAKRGGAVAASALGAELEVITGEGK